MEKGREMMKKIEVWEKINERTFDTPEQELLFLMIGENIGRIEFVKDHIGLRDYLFIAEEKAKFSFGQPLVLAIDVDARKEQGLQENEKKFKEKCIYDEIEIMETMERFFTTTDRTLYVRIGFSESLLTEMDKSAISMALKDGKIESAKEGARKIRRYPEWFAKNAKMPEEIDFITYFEEYLLESKLKKEIKIWLQNQIHNLLKKELLTETEEQLFENLCTLYKQTS